MDIIPYKIISSHIGKEKLLGLCERFLPKCKNNVKLLSINI